MIVWLIINLLTLTLYPAINCDETFYGRISLLFRDGLFSGNPWPDPGWLFFLPHGRTALFFQSIGITLFGLTLFGVRLYSLIGWLLTIVFSAIIGKQYTGSEKVGLWVGGLVSISWLGFYNGHHARPDMLAAAGIAGLIALMPPLINQQRNWPFLPYGFALIFVLDLHFNLLHFIWPLALLLPISLLRERQWARIGFLALGIFVGILALLWIHLGPAIGYLANQFLTDFDHVTEYYLGTSSEHVTVSGMLQSFGKFWWRYYGAFARWLSYPQAALFLFGTAWAIIKPVQRTHRWLGLIIVLSSLSYMIINSSYQLITYAILWLPLYIVAAVSAVFSATEKQAWIAPAILVLLGTTYLAGNAYLAIKLNTTNYWQDADRLLAGSEQQPGDRVIANNIWYFALVDHGLTFVSESLIETVQSERWWFGVPDVKRYQLPDIVPTVSTTAQSPDDLDYQLEQMLKPDYVLYTEQSHCPNEPSQSMINFIDWTENQCKLVNQIETEEYGQLRLFSCKP